MNDDDVAARAALRDLVRDGYDAISLARLSDDGQGRRNRRGLLSSLPSGVLVVCRLVRL